MIENLNKHIERSFKRLSDDIYSINRIWQNENYDWPGDFEGRALLAFVCLYEMTNQKIPCMDEMINDLSNHLNKEGYMGKIANGIADEQQLSGHSWLLRGLCEYYNIFKDEKSLKYANRIIKNLYLPLIDLYKAYPLNRNKSNEGGVSGSTYKTINNWKLSSDIGCAYMCLDGLTAYYEITKDNDVKKSIDLLINGFINLDRLALKCQTHATLTGARGIMRLYKITNEKKYLDYVIEIFDFYIKYGMTLNYENFNWFNKNDSWTEPCAVVDSFILSLWLYETTNEKRYQILASRIWFNGLLFCHRENGGAGPNTCVNLKQPYLNISMYEAFFCCSMRYCEGLKYAWQYEHIIISDDKIIKDEYGRVFKGNKLLVNDENNDFPSNIHIRFDNKDYIEIPTFVKNKNYKLKVF